PPPLLVRPRAQFAALNECSRHRHSRLRPTRAPNFHLRRSWPPSRRWSLPKHHPSIRRVVAPVSIHSRNQTFQPRRAPSFRQGTDRLPLQSENFLPVRAALQDRLVREQKAPADNSTSWSVPRSARSRQLRLVCGQEWSRPRQIFPPRREIRPRGLVLFRRSE